MMDYDKKLKIHTYVYCGAVVLLLIIWAIIEAW